MGDKVKIKVVAASLEKRQLDYEWVLTPVAADESTDDDKHTKGKRKRKNAA
jgi:ribonuclease R